MGLSYDSKTNSFFGETQNIPVLGQVMWHITNKCLLNCSMCFTKKMRLARDVLNKHDIPKYIYLLQNLGVKKIDLSGGEPLLFDDLSYLVELCVENGIAVTITTSGAGKQNNIEWLCNNWCLFSRIIVSLDGTKEIHNLLRGSESAFTYFYDFYIKLKETGCNIIRINTVVNSLLINEKTIEQFSQQIKDYSPQEWCLIEPYPLNKCKDFDRYTISHQQFIDFVAMCMKQNKIHIINRMNIDYAAYWSLYCDGYLYYSHNKEFFDCKVKLDKSNLEELRMNIKNNTQTYIRKIN